MREEMKKVKSITNPQGRGDWEVVGVEWLLVESITGNFF